VLVQPRNIITLPMISGITLSVVLR